MRYYTCSWDSCDKGFVRKADLSRHYQIHLDDRPYACPEEGCTKRFHQRSSLKIHQRTHTGERPYICEISTCQRAFSDPSSYARHQRSHRNERPYVCCVISCQQSFSRKHALHRHQLQHQEQDRARVLKPNPEIAFQAPLPDDSAPTLPFVTSSQPAIRDPGSGDPALDWCALDLSVIDDIVQQTIIQYNGPHPSHPAEGHADDRARSQPLEERSGIWSSIVYGIIFFPASDVLENPFLYNSPLAEMKPQGVENKASRCSGLR